jgi:DNA uptake protein ComE-like DNA-binding protein
VQSIFVDPADELPERHVERFRFDPNTADSTQLLRLGLQRWQVRNIYKFRAAGGIYRRKEDFAQLYGLTQKEYRELEPYITISADYQPASLLVKKERMERDTLLYPRKLTEGTTIDLSLADTAQLRRVPGIGLYFAREIVRYRDWLGGYVSVDQLDEIEGFPSEAKKYFTISPDAEPRRLNLNRLSLNELKRHPYINYYQARAIVDYRRQNGKLTSLDDLQFLHDFSSEARQRLAPYVTF